MAALICNGEHWPRGYNVELWTHPRVPTCGAFVRGAANGPSCRQALQEVVIAVFGFNAHGQVRRRWSKKTIMLLSSEQTHGV